MTHKSPKVSIIISTLNEEKNIERCLVAINNQTYSNIEVVVVDSPKTIDRTIKISNSLGAKTYVYGNERSEQRNYGVKMSHGEYVLIIDADMVLDNKVIESCISVVNSNNKTVGIIIPEISYGIGYWANCKALEKNCYIGDDDIEAARFINRSIFNKVGGYNPKMVSGEDWDLNRRIKKYGPILRISTSIHHYEGSLSLKRDLQKKYYYSQTSDTYIKENISSPIQVLKFIFRPAYFRNADKLLSDPLHLPGLILMKTLELVVGSFGAILMKKQFWRSISNSRSKF